VPPTAVASYAGVRSVSSRYHYRRESSSSAQGGASGARPRVASPPEVRVQKRVQSRAYAPPQGPPTRSPPITRDLIIPLAAAHTLTRVAEAKPRRPAGLQPPHSRDGNEDHPCGQLPPCYLQHTPSCPTSCTVAARERPAHSAARQNKYLRPRPLRLRICTGASDEMISHWQRCYSSTRRLGQGAGLMHRWSITKAPEDRRPKQVQLLHLTLASTVEKCCDSRLARWAEKLSAGEGVGCTSLVTLTRFGP